MKQVEFTVLQNEKLTSDVYRMVLLGDTSNIRLPGQFVEIALPGKFLRRPISVSDWKTNELTLIYRTVGSGTETMSQFSAGTHLDILTGLGNGYDLTASGSAPILVGGGVGIPPLYALCKKLLEQKKHPTVILGFNKASEIFLVHDFKNLGVPVIVATVDGSFGVKGFVTDALKDMQYSYFYACGPLPMYRAMERIIVGGGQYSMEERMGCGFGACMGCSIQTASGPKRICKDGPVFFREEVFGWIQK